MTIEQMCEKKRELGYSYEQIAELACLPLSTVQKVLGGITKSPRYDTLKALEEVFSERSDSLVKEAEPVYFVEKKQGEYTIEDYYAIPDDRRVELIDGVVYDMAAPHSIHQYLCGEIHALFRDYVRKNRGHCVPMISPIDVQLDCDDKTIVQPDVIILCDRSKFRYGRVHGAPDLIVEVLSPSTKKRDAYLKMAKYCSAGVKEYWMVDPDKKRIFVYEYDDKEVATIYTFDDEVPVGIYDGKCKINFAEIADYGQFLFEQEGI